MNHPEMLDIANTLARLNGYDVSGEEALPEDVWFGDGTIEVFSMEDEKLGDLRRTAEQGWWFEPAVSSTDDGTPAVALSDVA